MARHRARPATPADDDLLGELAADHVTRLTGRGETAHDADAAPAKKAPARIPTPPQPADAAPPEAAPAPTDLAEEAPADETPTIEDGLSADAPSPQTEDIAPADETHAPPAEQAPAASNAHAEPAVHTPDDAPASETTRSEAHGALEDAAEVARNTYEVEDQTPAPPQEAADTQPADTQTWPDELSEQNLDAAISAEDALAETDAPDSTAQPEANEPVSPIENSAQAAPPAIADAPPLPEGPIELTTNVRLDDEEDTAEEIDVGTSTSGLEGIESRVMQSPTMASGVGYLADSSDEEPPDTAAPQASPSASLNQDTSSSSGSFSVRIAGEPAPFDTTGSDEDDDDVALGAEPTNILMPEGSSDMYTVRIGPEEDSPEWPDQSSSPLNQLAMQEKVGEVDEDVEEDHDGNVAKRIAELISNMARQKKGRTEEEQNEQLATEALNAPPDSAAETSIAEELADEIDAPVEDDVDDEVVFEGMPAPPPPDEDDHGSPIDARTKESISGDVISMADLGDRKARRIKARARQDAERKREKTSARKAERSVAEDLLDEQMASEAGGGRSDRKDRSTRKDRKAEKKTTRSKQSSPMRSLANPGVIISPQPAKSPSRFRSLGVQAGIVVLALLATALLFYLLVLA